MNTKSKLLSFYGLFLPSGQFLCDFKNVASDYHIISCVYIQLTEHNHTQTWCSVAASWRFVTLGSQTSGPCNTDIEFYAYIVLKHQVFTACIAHWMLFCIFVWSRWMMIQHKIQPNCRAKDGDTTFRWNVWIRSLCYMCMYLQDPVVAIFYWANVKIEKRIIIQLNRSVLDNALCKITNFE